MKSERAAAEFETYKKVYKPPFDEDARTDPRRGVGVVK